MPSEIVSTLLEILHDAILYQLKEQECEVEFQPFLRFWLAVVAVAHLIRCVSTLLEILVFMEIPKWIKIRELTVSTLLEILAQLFCSISRQQAPPLRFNPS